MANWGSCDFRELEKMRDKLEQLSESDIDLFCSSVAKELAARLLAKVIKRTPVGQYSEAGKKGGTLRRGWTTQQSGSGSEGMKTSGASQYVDTLKVHYYDGNYIVEITNPIMYASYVEFGHRTANHQGWVDGKFMMTISEKELEQQAPSLIQKKLEKYLKEVFK
ncbi:MAG: HK97 gp10 family phage protein [Lachnotalea sp.]